jgi:signal transduction histidine kinase
VAAISATQRRVLFVWGLAIAPLVLLTIPFPPEDRAADVGALDWLAWGALYAAFLAGFWLAGRTSRTSRLRACLAFETVCVLALISTRPALGLEGVLFVSIAFQLGGESQPALAIAWIGAQATAMFAILDSRFGIDHALSVVAVYFPFQLLGWFTSRVLARESTAREELARVNAELLATRELLAANSRAAERLRISQELHDVFGHRLAALSLNLEAATRVAVTDRPRFVETAHAGVKGLLGDVREVVTNLRRSEPVDVAEILRLIVRDVPRPAIDLACPESLAVGDPEAAHVVVRCAQELVTNAIKHSDGEHLRLELRALRTGIEVIAADDGRGAAELHEGNGLRGMRERVAARGGTMTVDTAERAGFRVRLFVPGGAP